MCVKTEEISTDQMPYSSPSSSPILISSTSHEHETTYNYPITTIPSIITTPSTPSAEITTITSATTTIIATESFITDTTTTTTLRNVDATLAYVAVDKVEH